jgi:hypothetical protein
MGWKQVGGGGGDFIKWSDKTPGEGIEGIWKGTTPNQFESEDGSIELADGRTVRFGMPTALARRFDGDAERGDEPIAVGTRVKIVYEGRKNSKKGNSFHSFSVFVDDSAAPPF